jgi:hypothetical protein
METERDGEEHWGGEGEEQKQQRRKRFRNENRWELQELTRREPCNTSLAMAVNSHPCLDSSEPGIRAEFVNSMVRYLESGIRFRTSMVRGSGSGTQ